MDAGLKILAANGLCSSVCFDAPLSNLPLGCVYFHLCMYYSSPHPMHPLLIRMMYRCYLMICVASVQNNGCADCLSIIVFAQANSTITVAHTKVRKLNKPLTLSIKLWCIILTLFLEDKNDDLIMQLVEQKCAIIFF